MARMSVIFILEKQMCYMQPDVEIERVKLNVLSYRFTIIFILYLGNKPFQVLSLKIDFIYLARTYIPTVYSNRSNLLYKY